MPSRPRYLPDVRSEAAFGRIRRDEPILRPAVDVLCARHGWPPFTVRRFPDGSLPVYAVGGRAVLKLYPPVYRDERDVEALVLRTVEGRLSVPTPRVLAEGSLDGWGYLFMSRLHGRSLAAVWPDLAAGDRLLLADELGRSLRALHALRPAEPIPARPAWDAFLAGQRASATARQKTRGLSPKWLGQIDPFLAGVDLGDADRRALLHTEVMREHLLADATDEGWRLTGLFDFEPAMVGAPEYEFASVGLFVSCGERAVLRRLLSAYGYRAGAMDQRMAERFLAYALLHKYANFPWYLERVPPPPSVATLPELAAYWWGT